MIDEYQQQTRKYTEQSEILPVQRKRVELENRTTIDLQPAPKTSIDTGFTSEWVI